MAKIGRPRIHHDKDRPYKTISMYAEDGKKLEAIADAFEKSVGFRPGMTQILHVVIAAYQLPTHK